MKKDTGKTKYILLGLMAKQPQTGYSIKKSIENEFRHFWQESFGQIYPTLKLLVYEGFADCADTETSENRRRTITYTITEKGRLELKRWLSEAPDIEKLRYEILLKVSFGTAAEPEIIDEHLNAFIERNENALAEIEGFLTIFNDLEIPRKAILGSELTALCGKYLYTAMRDWAVEAKERIINHKELENETKNS
ncbi:PadR family transcriptional regulator [Acetobacterium wieringae]|uniref:PadR family transcriptional regulator n=1 Tax=Acetobacterium wieringae TaxID=52694 RepID=UPI0026EAB35C|nr:PadR family transcriptional regulator [Acetobacterium wieringae]